LPDDEKAKFLAGLVAQARKVDAVQNALTWLSGKKTYIIMAVMLGFVVAAAMGHPAPEWVYYLLASLGLGALRLGVAKGQAAAQDVLDILSICRGQTPADGKTDMLSLAEDALAQGKAAVATASQPSEPTPA